MRLARLAPSEYTVKTVSVDYQCLCWMPENSYFVPINFIEFSFSVRFTQLSFREPLRTEDTAVFYNIGKVQKIMNYYSIKRSFSLFLGKAVLLSHRCFAWRGSLSYIWWTILFLYLGTTELTHKGLSEISLGYVWMHQNLCMLNKSLACVQGKTQLLKLASAASVEHSNSWVTHTKCWWPVGPFQVHRQVCFPTRMCASWTICLYSFTSIYLWGCMFVCVQLYTYPHTCRGQRATSSVIPQELSTTFLEIVSQWPGAHWFS